MRYYFKKVDLGISGKGIMIYEQGEVQNPKLILMDYEVEELNKEWNRKNEKI